MYINWYGCEVYPAGAYALAKGLANDHGQLSLSKHLPTSPILFRQGGAMASDDGGEDGIVFLRTRAGVFPRFTCAAPEAQPAAAAAFFISFTLLTSFVILSLLVGRIPIKLISPSIALKGQLNALGFIYFKSTCS